MHGKSILGSRDFYVGSHVIGESGNKKSWHEGMRANGLRCSSPSDRQTERQNRQTDKSREILINLNRNENQESSNILMD